MRLDSKELMSSVVVSSFLNSSRTTCFVEVFYYEHRLVPCIIHMLAVKTGFVSRCIQVSIADAAEALQTYYHANPRFRSYTLSLRSLEKYEGK